MVIWCWFNGIGSEFNMVLVAFDGDLLGFDGDLMVIYALYWIFNGILIE